MIVVDEDVEVGARDLLELPGRRGGWEEGGGKRRGGKGVRSPSKRRRKRARKEPLPSPEGTRDGNCEALFI